MAQDLGDAGLQTCAAALAEVIWSSRALSDLQAIINHISRFRPIAARNIGNRLFDAGNKLKDFPEQGRRYGSIRELATVPPYVIRYRVGADRVEILRIKHGAQRL